MSISNNELLTVQEIAEILKVTEASVYSYMKRKINPLPSMKLSPQVIRIRKEEFKKWLESQEDPRNEV